MQRKLLLCLLSGLAICNAAAAFTEQAVRVTSATTPKLLRTHSSRHHIASVRNASSMVVPGLLGGCTSIFLVSEDDPWTFATLSGAFNNNATFTVRYDTELRAPWDPNSCAITSVSYGE